VNVRIGKKAVASKSRKRKSREKKEVEIPPPKIWKVEGPYFLAPAGVWKERKCMENDLLRLVAEGLLQDRDAVEWRPAGTDAFPFEMIGETILFTHFVERGFAPMPSGFLRGLL
jgi:hypothetical protein